MSKDASWREEQFKKKIDAVRPTVSQISHKNDKGGPEPQQEQQQQEQQQEQREWF